MRIACIGNAVYDITVSSENFLVEGVRNSFTNASFNAGGPASNAASVIARFGNEVDFYGRIGNDENGKYIYNKMQSENINLKHLTISETVMTPFSFVILNTFKDTRTICTVRDAVDYGTTKIGNTIYESGYDYILTDGKYVEDTINLMKANPGAKTIIDAGRANGGVMALCHLVDYIICSEDFANKVTGETINDDHENNVMIYERMKQLYPQAQIVITIGGKGQIIEKNGEVIVNPAYNPEKPIVDTNGAGDIFHGAFTFAIANGYEYYEALDFAGITASLSITKPGGRDSCPDLEEVTEVLKNKPSGFVRKIKPKTSCA